MTATAGVAGAAQPKANYNLMPDLPYYQEFKGAQKQEAATTGAVYSNSEDLSDTGYATTPAGSSTVTINTGTSTLQNTTSLLLADDLNFASNVQGGTLTQFKFSVENFNSTATSFREGFRFFLDNGSNGPGAYIGGFSFRFANFPGEAAGHYYTDVSSLGLQLPTASKIWEGVTFDNNTSAYATTAAQLDNLGVDIYDPPVVGTSSENFFETDNPPTDGYYTTSNPAGTLFNSGTDAFDNNLYTEINGPSITFAPTSWNVDSDGTYTTAANWSAGTPASNYATAIFGTKITANRTVTLSSNQGVGTVIFNNAAASYTIAGTGTLGVGNSVQGGLIQVQAGTHSITCGLLTDASTTIDIAAGSQLTATQFNDSVYGLTKTGAGTFITNRTQAGTLTVSAGTMKIAAGGPTVNTVGTFAIAGGPSAPTAKLDITDNDIIFGAAAGQAGVKTALQGYVKYARDGGLWDRAGITTSSALPTGAQLSPKGIGIVSGAEYMSLSASNTTFDGVAITSGNTLLKFTYNGDADLNGKINSADYHQIDTGFQSQNTAGFAFDWFNGDFDYNGVINSGDYALIDQAYQLQSGTLKSAVDFLETGVRPTGDIPDSLQEVLDHDAQFGAAYANAFIFAAVPEPTTISVLGIATAGLLARRRRQSI